jgi:hypothetical protein
MHEIRMPQLREAVQRGTRGRLSWQSKADRGQRAAERIRAPREGTAAEYDFQSGLGFSQTWVTSGRILELVWQCHLFFHSLDKWAPDSFVARDDWRRLCEKSLNQAIQKVSDQAICIFRFSVCEK